MVTTICKDVDSSTNSELTDNLKKKERIEKLYNIPKTRKTVKKTCYTWREG